MLGPTILLPQQVEFLCNWLPYSNIQITFKLSWIESIGSVLDSVSFLACGLQCAQNGNIIQRMLYGSQCYYAFATTGWIFM